MPNLSGRKNTVKPQYYPYDELTGNHSIWLLHVALIDRESYIVYGWLQEVQSVEDVQGQYLALSYTWGPPLMGGFEPDVPFRPRFRFILFPLGLEHAGDHQTTFPMSHEMEYRIRTTVFTTHYELPLAQNLSDFFLTVDLAVSFQATGGALPLWIDALCINQQDSTEVNRHLMIMGDVYNWCRKTLVWLGPDSRDLGGVEWILGEAGEEIIKQRPQDETTADQRISHWLSNKNIVMEEFWRDLGVQIPPATIHRHTRDFGPVAESFISRGMSAQGSLFLTWLSWCRFFNSRAWFHRAWVMQEVAAVPGVFVVAGTLHFAWERLFDMDRLLCWGSQYLTFNSALIPLLGLQGKVHGPHYDMYLAWYRSLYKLYFPTEVQKSMPSDGGDLFFQVMELIMRHSRKKKSSVARDKVGCIIGIASRTLPKLPVPKNLVDWLVITHNEDARTAFLRLQTILLCADRFRSLALLRLVHHASNEAMTGSLSWVIDWAADDTPDPFDYGRQRLSNGGIDAPQIPEMISRSDGMAIAAISDARLCVDALCLSTVKDSFRTRIAPTSHALSAVLEVLSLLGPTYQKTGEPLEAALFAVMTASNCPEGFGQSNLDHICNLIANTTVSGLYGLWAKGLTAKSATMESGGVFWSITGRDADETQEEDWLGTHIFPPRSSTSPSNLVKALGRAETALSIVVAYITGSSWQAEPGWTWETPLSPAEITLQAYQQRILRGRALFVTGDGLLGLGPGIAQADDELWLIAGRRVPCLLRRVPESKGGGRDKYWFVGEAWVHGIMDGEWMEDGVAPVFKRIELV